MARRKSKRQAKPKELIANLLIIGTILLLACIVLIPQVVLYQVIILGACIAILIVVAYYYPAYRKLVAYRNGLAQLPIEDIDSMPGVLFERYVGEMFRKQGYHIEYTPIIGDYGVDIVIGKNAVRTAVQVKRYSKRVDQAAIREVVAGMKHYKCTQSMVVTNSYFTKSAQDLAGDNNCKLIDRNGLVAGRILKDYPSIS